MSTHWEHKTIKFVWVCISCLVGLIGIPLLGYGIMISIAFSNLNKLTWSEDNRILHEDHFSPDSSKTIGYYNYDAGALGYTAMCISIVNKGQKYPIEGNVFTNYFRLKYIEWPDLKNTKITVQNYGAHKIVSYSKKVNGVNVLIDIDNSKVINQTK